MWSTHSEKQHGADKIGEDHINIYGTQLPQRFYRNEDFSHHDLPQITKDELTKLLGEPDRSECNFCFRTHRWRSVLMRTGEQM